MKRVSALLAFSLVAATPSLGATRTWTGIVGTAWTNAINWGGTAPVAGDNLIFPPGAANLSNNNDFPGGTSFNTIVFSSSGYVLSGNPIALNAGVTSNSGGVNTIALGIALSNTQLWSTTLGSPLVMTAPMNTNGHNLVLGGTGEFEFQSSISGAGGIQMTGTLSATLSGANSYAGLTDIVSGCLTVNNPLALSGIGTTVESGACLVIGNNVVVSGEPLTLNGTGDAGIGVNGALAFLSSTAGQWNGPITLGTNPVRIAVNAPGTLILGGQIGGSGGIEAGGNGVIALLNGSNNFSGGLTFGSSDAVTVRLGADNAIPSTAIVNTQLNPSGNTLDLNNHVDTIQGLRGSGIVTLGSGVLTTSSGPGGFTFFGAMTGSGGVTTISGSGVQELEGPGISYSGQTDVNGGFLELVDATIQDVVVRAGTLMIAGNTSARNINVLGGNFQPAGPSGAGTLNCQALNITGGTYGEGVNNATPGNFGSLTVTGSVTLGGTLSLNGSFNPTPAQSYTMINNTGVNPLSGTFNGVPEGSVIIGGPRAFHITYQGGDGNDVVLTELAARGDFNGDMLGDVFWRHATTGSNSMWLMNGIAVGSSFAEPLVDPSFKIAGTGDFQGDGKADILWRNSSTGANVVWLMNGSTVAASAVLPTVSDLNWTVAGVGDLQGDGKADIVWRNTVTGDNAVWFMDGLSVAVAASLPSVPDTNWKIVAVADLQGDAKADLVWRNSAIGANSVWLMNGPAVAVSAALPSVPDTNWQIVGAGDFQGDGKADLLWRNSATGDNAMWLMNGTSVAVSATLPSVPDTNWKIVKIGDFQGDGKADIFWRHSVAGGNSVWLMDGPNVALSAALPTVSDPNWQVAGPP